MSELVKQTTIIDPEKLWPGFQTFNGSIAEFNGKTYLAYRMGWSGANVILCELGPDLRPIHSGWPVQLSNPLCKGAREDPRLWTYQNELYLSFVGAESNNGGWLWHQCIGKFNPGLTSAEVFAPHYANRQPIEKNWGFFSAMGDLWAVYSICPHVVLRVYTVQAEEVARTNSLPQWNYGFMRGGAPPIRIGNEFWNFFHGMAEVNRFKTYTVGLYTFEVFYPFRPLRWIPFPIYQGDYKDKIWWANVVFPAGVILRGKDLLVSCGYQDKENRILHFNLEELDRALVPL